MLKLDKNTVFYFEGAGIEKIKIFFYDSGCSGTKIDLVRDFEITDELEKLDLSYGFEVYAEKKDKQNLENCMITRVIKADHTGKEKIRYIFSSQEVKDRCGCGTSFSFEKKKIKIDLSKLKELKNKVYEITHP